MSAVIVLVVTGPKRSVRTTICAGGRLSTIVERKLNLPEIGPTAADMMPSKVLSSICFTSSMPGRHVENLLMSIKKSHAFCAGTSRSILPWKIYAAAASIQPILCEKNHADKRALSDCLL